MKCKAICHPVNILMLLSGIILLIYTGYRCYFLSFTHDESVTYLKLVHNSSFNLLINNTPFVSANNHVLNSLCMKYSELLFGPGEFALRIQSLIAHVIYLIFTYLLIKDIKPKWLQLIGFLFLNLNPYLLDFFSLARGYGLAIAFMLMSIFYFMQYAKKDIQKYMIISLIAALLSCLSNFSMLTFTAALILLFEYLILLKRYRLTQYIVQNIPILITFIFIFFLYHWPINQLMVHGELYFGGKESLWNDTVMSSIVRYLDNTDYLGFSVIFLKILLLTVIFFHLYILIIKLKTHSIQARDYIFVIFMLTVGIHFFQHVFMGTNFFTERVAVFLVVLFFLSFINVVDYFWQKNSLLKITTGVFVLSMMLLIGLVSKDCLNTTYTANWSFDADTRFMLKDLTLIRKHDLDRPITIGTTWVFEPSINFYKKTKSLKWLQQVNRDGLVGDYDYYYVDASELKSFDQTNKSLIKIYPVSKASLFKKNQ